jgi:hypothetical protein
MVGAMDPHFRRPPAPREQFEEFQASALYCPRCRSAQPVRERLLLILPDGELREYLCAACGSSLGERRVTAERPVLIAR